MVRLNQHIGASDCVPWHQLQEQGAGEAHFSTLAQAARGRAPLYMIAGVRRGHMLHFSNAQKTNCFFFQISIFGEGVLLKSAFTEA
jgi:hypothetical protein